MKGDQRRLKAEEHPNHRYRDDDRRPSSLNSKHYEEALQICMEFEKSISQDSEQPLLQSDDDRSLIPLSDLVIAEENRRLPSDGFFSFVGDLLGFTKEVSNGGMDSLPDFYGGALAAANENSNVHVYLLSDSCLSFTYADNMDEFIQFVTKISSAWLSNGLLPRCSIGYGSFAERKPAFGIRPENFFGTQITGTAVSDAMGVLNDRRRLGVRILLSESAWRHWPDRLATLIVSDGHGKEVFPQRPLLHYIFECLYYLLCLREHDPVTRIYKHYVWSAASRVRAGGSVVRQFVYMLASPHVTGEQYELYLSSIDEALRHYDNTGSGSPP